MKKSSKLSKTLNKKKARDWFIIKFEFNILELPLKPKYLSTIKSILLEMFGTISQYRCLKLFIIYDAQ